MILLYITDSSLENWAIAENTADTREWLDSISELWETEYPSITITELEN